MNAFKDRLERIQVEEPVNIPTLDGTGIAETVTVKVPAWRDPKDGEIYLDTEAAAILDKVKARRMGLLTPEQIKALRERLDLTQKQISELLQIGEKTWTRWETGRERPSRSINVLLSALNDGKIDVYYLRSLSRQRSGWAAQLIQDARSRQNPWMWMVQDIWKDWELEKGQEPIEALCQYVVGMMVARATQPNLNMTVETKFVMPSYYPSSALNLQPWKSPVLKSRSTKPAESTGQRFQICKESIAA